ncbi:DUF4839 domain-containing protein [Nocardioides rubriscoriae]|uniref:DUF4839 domain-containing protein n=1 Tax=Nocardioides rubriscoriae TaxID=642762 RepID=UPI0011E04AD3|nr:DUF4839 domain-containing protein [Nocardioides rubriscoriae]
MHNTVKVVRGREAAKIAELTSDGWELIEQQSGPLRTELTFRKIQPQSPFTKLTAAFHALAPATQRTVIAVTGGIAVALIALVVVLTVATSGDDEDTKDPVATNETAASNTEPSASPPAASSTKTPTAPPTPAPEPAVITAKNTPEFEALLSEDECAKGSAAFAKAHEGDKILFDGTVVNIAPHGNFDTRFDYLLGPGDDGPNTTQGAILRYEDVNYYDFGLTGKNQPESLDVGGLFRFTATLEGYNPQTCIFALSPVETEAR